MKTFKLSALAIVGFFVLSSFVSIHKYYVSVTDIEYVNKTKSLQIISRLFIDDFEKVLEERYEKKIYLENEESDIYLQKYFSKKLLIKINNKFFPARLIGKEVEDDMIHCYLEIENINSIKTIEITNKLFFDLFDSQQNISHINVKGEKKSFLFIKDNATGLLKF
jgi:hypothetical protein